MLTKTKNREHSARLCTNLTNLAAISVYKRLEVTYTNNPTKIVSNIKFHSFKRQLADRELLITHRSINCTALTQYRVTDNWVPGQYLWIGCISQHSGLAYLLLKA